MFEYHIILMFYNVEQRERTFYKWLLLSPWGGGICLADTNRSVEPSHFLSFLSEAMTLWAKEHRVFAYDGCIKTNRFVIALLREFQPHLELQLF